MRTALKGLIRCVTCVVCILIGAAACKEDRVQRRDDSLCADARELAIEEFLNNDFLVDDTLLGNRAYYAEEIFYTVYGLKPVVRQNIVIECGTPFFGNPRYNRCYKSTIDSLLFKKLGSNYREMIKFRADSLYASEPGRYGNDCFFSPHYIPNEDSMYAHLRKNLRYPANAILDSVAGVVYVRLDLDSSGSVIATAVVRGVRHDLDSAALSAALKLGKFRTECRWGITQPGQVTIPIKFSLQ